MGGGARRYCEAFTVVAYWMRKQVDSVPQAVLNWSVFRSAYPLFASLSQRGGDNFVWYGRARKSHALMLDTPPCGERCPSTCPKNFLAIPSNRVLNELPSHLRTSRDLPRCNQLTSVDPWSHESSEIHKNCDGVSSDIVLSFRWKAASRRNAALL